MMLNSSNDDSRGDGIGRLSGDRGRGGGIANHSGEEDYDDAGVGVGAGLPSLMDHCTAFLAQCIQGLIVGHADYTSTHSPRATFERHQLSRQLPAVLHKRLYRWLGPAAVDTAPSSSPSLLQCMSPIQHAGHDYDEQECWRGIYEWWFGRRRGYETYSFHDHVNEVLSDAASDLYSRPCTTTTTTTTTTTARVISWRDRFLMEFVSLCMDLAVDCHFFSGGNRSRSGSDSGRIDSSSIPDSFLSVNVDPRIVRRYFENLHPSADMPRLQDRIFSVHWQWTIGDVLKRFGSAIRTFRVANMLMEDKECMSEIMPFLSGVTGLELHNMRSSSVDGAIHLLLNQSRTIRSDVAEIESLKIMHAHMDDESMCRILYSMLMDSDQSDGIFVSTSYHEMQHNSVVSRARKGNTAADAFVVNDEADTDEDFDIYGDLEFTAGEDEGEPKCKRQRTDSPLSENSEFSRLFAQGIHPGIKDTLRTLSIHSTPVSLRVCEILADLMRDIPHLCEFEMSFNRLDAPTAEVFMSALAQCGTLKRITITENDIDINAIQHLANAIRDALPNLTDLSMCNDDIPAAGISMLLDALVRRTHRTITSLDISHNELSGDNVDLLCRLIAADSCNLIMLNIGHCDINDPDHIARISRALATNRSLRSMNMSSSLIAESSRHIASMIASNTTLQILNLSHCAIVLNEALVQSVSSNSTLRVIDFTGNPLYDAHYPNLLRMLIEESLERHKQLVSLNLSNTRMSNAIALDLIAAFEAYHARQTGVNKKQQWACVFLDLQNNNLSNRIRTNLKNELTSLVQWISVEMCTDEPADGCGGGVMTNGGSLFAELCDSGEMQYMESRGTDF